MPTALAIIIAFLFGGGEVGTGRFGDAFGTGGAWLRPLCSETGVAALEISFKVMGSGCFLLGETAGAAGRAGGSVVSVMIGLPVSRSFGSRAESAGSPIQQKSLGLSVGSR